jgi:hypothetical protein
MDSRYINSLIYRAFTESDPTRCEMINYATWRAYLIYEMDSISSVRTVKSVIETYSKQFPRIAYTDERREFYDFVFKPTEPSNSRSPKEQERIDRNYRNDSISHFICRMLYSQ